MLEAAFRKPPAILKIVTVSCLLRVFLNTDSEAGY
jgi:hypothetical protein